MQHRTGYMSNTEYAIKIKNARIHNLKGIDVTIPKNNLTVITGYQGAESQALHLIRFMKKVKEDILCFRGHNL